MRLAKHQEGGREMEERGWRGTAFPQRPQLYVTGEKYSFNNFNLLSTTARPTLIGFSLFKQNYI